LAAGLDESAHVIDGDKLELDKLEQLEVLREAQLEDEVDKPVLAHNPQRRLRQDAIEVGKSEVAQRRQLGKV
jgi:hypothetical protein